MGEYDAVSAARRFALLADQIKDLSERVEELHRQAEETRQQRAQDSKDVAAVKTAVAQWAARLQVEGIGPTLMMRRDIKNLAEKVDALAGALGTALDQGKLKGPAAPRWDNLDKDQEAAQLAALREWVNGVLRVQYPEYTLPGCWEAHRAALWELGALQAEWQRVFGDPRGVSLESLLWFHERWLPGAVNRLNKAISTDTGCRAHGYDGRGQRPRW
jgi:hypothetical protein